MTTFWQPTLLADDVAQILANQPGNQTNQRSAADLKNHWIVSSVFRLVPIRCGFVGVSKPKPSDRSTSHEPIIVETNVNKVGREVYSEEGGHGDIPELLVIDGQHRWYEAQDAGKLTMDAYVGDKALPAIEHLWHRFADRVGPPMHSFFADELPGGALAALRHLLPPEQIENIRKARKIYKETKRLPPYILHDYPFIIER